MSNLQRVKPVFEFDHNPVVSLGGPVGKAATDITARLHEAPFSSVEWLRADLTGETVGEFDEVENHTWYRPFKNFSGDISGRFLEAMAMADPTDRPKERLDQLVQAILKHQHPDGSFAAFGAIDWQQPIDHGDLFTVKMMPALWGNSRLFCGLVEAAKAFDDDALLACAKRLGDFYKHILPRFTDVDRMDEYRDGGTFAAGYVTCYFLAMEGLVKLYNLCGETSYLHTAMTMADFYADFDTIPIDHSHGMLCCHVSLLLIYEATGQKKYLQVVESRWDELVTGGYINAAGGILEKCRPTCFRDEGCAVVDWLRLNLALARLTGKDRYWAMAERVLLNHLLQNQCSNGGFGHRNCINDDAGLIGFKDEYEEATWCCCFHGMLAFEILKNNLCAITSDTVRLPLAIDFQLCVAEQTVASSLTHGGGDDEIFRQTVSLDKASDICIRRPGWADEVSAVDGSGKELALTTENGWISTQAPVREATFIYRGTDTHEQRRPAPSADATQTVTYRGPWLLGMIDGEEPEILSDATRNKCFQFWSGN